MLTLRLLRGSRTTRGLARSITGSRVYSCTSDQNRDPLHQTRDASKNTRTHPKTAGPFDAATSETTSRKKVAREEYSGNPENIGMVDQVGSQSASANKRDRSGDYEGKLGQERITPPSFTDAVKKKMGLGTTVGEDKQNRGGGEGVTGTGIPRFDSGKRLFSTMGPMKVDKRTKGQAPDRSRQPTEKTNAEQSPHLKHRSASGPGGSSRKGSAAENPTSPSHQVSSLFKLTIPLFAHVSKFGDKLSKSPAETSAQKRTFSTSASIWEDKPKHTAESYFKDVDSSPPSSTKTHQVDPSGTGAAVQRPNENLTGDFSRAGTQTKEYETVSIGINLASALC